MNSRDLSGERFGRLTVMYRVTGKNRSQKAVWHCRCDCGNETDVYAGNLLDGRTVSCGCLNREQSAGMHDHMHYQNGTCAEILRRVRDDNCSRKSKAGFRGLFLTKSGKYRASITFQGKHYTLGYYGDFNDAVRARLEAEESLHAGYLKALAKYEEKAAADPAWAEAHPFFYKVERAGGVFKITTNAGL